MRLLLHIGNHKTGSTTIQNSAKEEEENLLDKYGILYPKTFRIRGGAHHFLPATILSDKTLFGQEINTTIEELINEFKNEIKLKNPQLFL